jgi:hypothetical protein
VHLWVECCELVIDTERNEQYKIFTVVRRLNFRTEVQTHPPRFAKELFVRNKKTVESHYPALLPTLCAMKAIKYQ